MDYEEIFKYMTRNRKLKLEEYDDDGNIINIREFSDDVLFDFINQQTNSNKALLVAKIKDLNMFNEEEIEIIQRIIDYSIYKQFYLDNKDEQRFYWFRENEANKFRNFLDKFNGNYSMLNFALDLCMGVFSEGSYVFNTSLKSQYAFKKFTLSEALNFIENRDGIYYTVNNNGKRVYDFVDKPTKKQVKYQRTKNGNRTVFFNFKNWKEYLLSEDEL